MSPLIQIQSAQLMMPVNFILMICNKLSNAELKVPLMNEDRNRITYSSLTSCEIVDYYAPTYSIKYVWNGTEHYFLNGKKRSVSAGNFLIVNADNFVDARVSSKKPVQGFCLHIEKKKVQDAVYVAGKTDDELLSDPFRSACLPQFDAVIYNSRDNLLGNFLDALATQYTANRGSLDLDEVELFHHLAGRLASLHHGGRRMTLSTMRNSTREELFRRIGLAKQVIDSDPCAPHSIAILAREALLSESHFLHSFKKVYGISPYQYLIRRRLETAAKLLAVEGQNVGQIALTCGFADGASFSKSFKKFFGVAPRLHNRV